jgi:hypothetical protein
MQRVKRISNKTLAIAIIALLLAVNLMMTFTGAWFTSTDGASDGGMTFGTVTLEDIDASFSYDLGEASLDVLMPGDEIDVGFRVENAGTADMWVRFSLDVGGNGEQYFQTPVSGLAPTGYTYSDGYFYRNSPMIGDLDGQANGGEDILMTFVIPTTTGDAAEGATVSFTLIVDAVQVANNGATGEEAQGWPLAATEGVVYSQILSGPYAGKYSVTDYEGTDTDVVIASKYLGVDVVGVEYPDVHSAWDNVNSITLPQTIEYITQKLLTYPSDHTSGGSPISLFILNANSVLDTLIVEEELGTALVYVAPSMVNQYNQDPVWGGNFFIMELNETTQGEITYSALSDTMSEQDNLPGYLPDYSLTGLYGPISNGMSETSIVIPSEYEGTAVTGIGEMAFIGMNFTTMGPHENNYMITDVTLPNTITKIGSYAFVFLPNLTSIVIPESVTHIGYIAFMDSCLTEITLLSNSVVNMYEPFGTTVGDGTMNLTIKVPAALVDDYEAAYPGYHDGTNQELGWGVTVTFEAIV